MPPKQKFELALSALQEFGDLSKMGTTELVNMYFKFLRYCLDGSIDRYSYSQKVTGKPEQFFIYIEDDGKRIYYRLNPETRLYEEQKQKNLGEGPSI